MRRSSFAESTSGAPHAPPAGVALTAVASGPSAIVTHVWPLESAAPAALKAEAWKQTAAAPSSRPGDHENAATHVAAPTAQVAFSSCAPAGSGELLIAMDHAGPPLET